MSRIGSKPISIPSGVSVEASNGSVSVKGPKGQLSRIVVDGISVETSDNTVNITRSGDSPRLRGNHGLMRALIANMVTGVSVGFERNLEIIGVGYKAAIKNNSLEMNLGFSHPIVYPFPEGITLKVVNNTVTVSGIDKEKVGQVASVLRGYRPPDSYKGKGVRYQGETIRLKVGKSA